MERLYGSLMMGFGRMSKSRVTKSIVNCVRSIYVKGDPLHTAHSARQKDVHRFVDSVTESQDCLSTVPSVSFVSDEDTPKIL